MRMEGAGLLEFWLKQYSDDATYCLTKIRRQMKEKRGKRRLTLNNLSGAFLVLIIGYVLSIIAFIIELCTARRQRRYKNKKTEPLRKPAVVVNSSDAPKTYNTVMNVVKLAGTSVADAEVPPATTLISYQKLAIDISNPHVPHNKTQVDISAAAAATVIIPSEQLENDGNSLAIVDIESNESDHSHE